MLYHQKSIRGWRATRECFSGSRACTHEPEKELRYPKRALLYHCTREHNPNQWVIYISWAAYKVVGIEFSSSSVAKHQGDPVACDQLCRDLDSECTIIADRSFADQLARPRDIDHLDRHASWPLAGDLGIGSTYRRIECKLRTSS